jgi:hypothetical protein
MTDEAIMALLAAGLVNPRVLLALQSNCEAAIDGGLTPDQQNAAGMLDRERLALFAGFITMVRHNSDLFAHLPGTLQMLRHYGVELAVFRDHFLTKGSPSKARCEKIEVALTMLAEFASTRRARRLTGFRDVLLHEQCNWEIQQEFVTGLAAGASTSTTFAASAVPVFTGPVRVVRVTREPSAVLAALAGSKSVRSLPRQPQWLLYLGEAKTHSIRVMRVTREVSEFVKLINGRTTCAGIVARLTRTRPSAGRRARGTLRGLFESGVIRYCRERPT